MKKIKSVKINVRISLEDFRKLDKVIMQRKISRSDAIRLGIKKIKI